jgi:hypothetical protein
LNLDSLSCEENRKERGETGDMKRTKRQRDSSRTYLDTHRKIAYSLWIIIITMGHRKMMRGDPAQSAQTRENIASR